MFFTRDCVVFLLLGTFQKYFEIFFFNFFFQTFISSFKIMLVVFVNFSLLQICFVFFLDFFPRSKACVTVFKRRSHLVFANPCLMDFYHLSYNEAESITSYTIATFFLQLEIAFRDILEAPHVVVRFSNPLPMGSDFHKKSGGEPVYTCWRVLFESTSPSSW